MAQRSRQSLALGTAPARVPDHVVHRSLAHETVVLNLKTGRYHGLNPTAGRMLSELETGASLHEIAVRLEAVYERPVEELQEDLRALCFDLLQRGLIELVDSNGVSFENDASAADA
jgi:Coenzyme PQQ synthesis protein D (PqqD)